MKIAVIGAMNEEITFLKTKMKNLKEEKVFPYDFFTGNLYENEIVLVESGIGKVSSGALFATLVNKYKDLDVIFNVGVSGGVKGKTNTGDVVISSKFSYLDADVRAFGYKYGQMASCPEYFLGDKEIIELLEKENFEFKKGMILSSDRFMTDHNFLDSILNEHFKEEDVYAVDMESTAFAQMAHLFKKRFLAIRVISDVIGENSQVEGYNSSLEYASVKSNEFLIKLLEKIK